MYVPLGLSDSWLSLESGSAYCNSLMNASFYFLDCEMLSISTLWAFLRSSYQLSDGTWTWNKTTTDTWTTSQINGGFYQLEDSGSHLDRNTYHLRPCWAKVVVHLLEPTPQEGLGPAHM